MSAALTMDTAAQARMLMPATAREHGVTMQAVLIFWREVMSDMHGVARTSGDSVDAGVVDCWIEKLDLLLKVANESADDLVKQLRVAGYSRQLPSGGVNLGQWQT